MLRTFSKTTWMASLITTSLCLGLLLSSEAMAQHHGSCSSCDGGAGACGSACPTCGIGCGSCRMGACAGGLCNQAPNCRAPQYGQANLFHNYYVPGTCGGVPAQMYLAPRPVPALVGHTYFTYEPFMPHEQLYQHHRTYHRYYDNGRGLNRTHVSWYRPPVRSAGGSLLSPFKIAR